MATRTAAEMIRDLLAAGFTRAQAIIMAAIGLAESGGNDTALGDLALQNTTWGPSIGLYQIRTLKADTGTGGMRDIATLTGDDLRQAQAAYAISRSGTDFTPWTVYTSGAYRQYLSQAQAAANRTSTVEPTDWVVPLPPQMGGGFITVPDPRDLDPRDDISRAVASGRALAMKITFGLLGLALIGAGVIRMVAPKAWQAGKSTVRALP